MSEHPSVMTTSSAPLSALLPSSTHSTRSPSGATTRVLVPSLASSEKRRTGREGADGSEGKGRSWMQGSDADEEEEVPMLAVERAGRGDGESVE